MTKPTHGAFKRARTGGFPDSSIEVFEASAYLATCPRKPDLPWSNGAGPAYSKYCGLTSIVTGQAVYGNVKDFHWKRIASERKNGSTIVYCAFGTVVADNLKQLDTAFDALGTLQNEDVVGIVSLSPKPYEERRYTTIHALSALSEC